VWSGGFIVGFFPPGEALVLTKKPGFSQPKINGFIKPSGLALRGHNSCTYSILCAFLSYLKFNCILRLADGLLQSKLSVLLMSLENEPIKVFNNNNNNNNIRMIFLGS